MQKVYLSTNFTKLNENYGLPDCFTDYQIRHLGNPSGLPEILLKIDPAYITNCRFSSLSFNLSVNVLTFSVRLDCQQAPHATVTFASVDASLGRPIRRRRRSQQGEEHQTDRDPGGLERKHSTGRTTLPICRPEEP